jgi:hypothetical protein
LKIGGTERGGNSRVDLLAEEGAFIGRSNGKSGTQEEGIIMDRFCGKSGAQEEGIVMD